ncbi:YIP1 family protein [Chloroflexota bacterium]
MDGIVDSLRLGWNALLLKEEAYEEMSTATNPVVKGLVLIVVVGVVIALLALVGTVLEWATMPDLGEIKDIIFGYIWQMPGMSDLASENPGFVEQYQRGWDISWQFMPQLFGAPDVGGAALGIIFTPLGLVIRWLIYSLLAYLFARWLGGSADLSVTLGVLALTVAPMALNALALIPYVEVGNVVAVWGILCAYTGLKTAHKLPWTRAVWATLLPFLLVLAILILFACLGSTGLAWGFNAWG